MKGEKYHIYLSTKERNEIVAFLINLKNKVYIRKLNIINNNYLFNIFNI